MLSFLRKAFQRHRVTVNSISGPCGITLSTKDWILFRTKCLPLLVSVLRADHAAEAAFVFGQATLTIFVRFCVWCVLLCPPKVYYEDYNTNFNETAMGILKFLELDLVGELREFSSRSDYDKYFSKEEVEEIKKMVQNTANDRTWEQVKHYFDGV